MELDYAIDILYSFAHAIRKSNAMSLTTKELLKSLSQGALPKLS